MTSTKQWRVIYTHNSEVLHEGLSREVAEEIVDLLNAKFDENLPYLKSETYKGGPVSCVLNLPPRPSPSS